MRLPSTAKEDLLCKVRYRCARSIRSTVLISLAWLLASRAAVAQTADIQITTPADGAIVAPGQTINVTVSVGAQASVTTVGIVAEDIGFGASGVKSSPPYVFPLTIPTNVVGLKKVSAVGITALGTGVFSPSISIDVRPAAALSFLVITPTPIRLDSLGEQLPLTVTGTFADGSILEVSRSSLTTYASQDPGVATVDATGTVTATGGGSTYVTVSYNNRGQPASTVLSQVVSFNLTCSSDGPTNAILVEHYYTTILRRPSDPAGKASWMSEADRLCALGADPKETFFLMANVFFNTPEYLAFNRDNSGFVTDLYNAFFSRVPDAAGLSYWLGQLASGMPRDNVMSSFLFSAEFTATMNAAFPGQTARAETYLVLNLYGGLLRRLAETGGYTYWTGQFRTAQCNSSAASAVQSTIDSVSRQFVASAEYAARATSNSQYVDDLYYALLQRGAELAGYNYWVGQLNGGILTRGQVRQQFLSSPEMRAQSAAIAAQGCLP
jgi:hypothetical protein